MDAVVAVLGTLDTKGTEVAFLAEALRRRGIRPSVIDIGLRGTPSVQPDIPRDLLAAAAGGGASREDRDERQKAMATMASGAAAILLQIHEEGRLLGAIGIGGSKGTWMASAAMRALPWGIPKVMVASTVAGDLRRYAGHRDIVFMPTVVDLAGLNPMTRLVLERGAAVLAGLIAVPAEARVAATVAMTMAGVVTPLGQRVHEALLRRGIEPLVFPANGAGGMALEEAVAAGQIHSVVDLALLELSNELVGGVCSAGPARLEAAGQAGVPQVIVPGAVEFANFAGPDSVPENLRSREIIEHTPAITLVRLTTDESRELGRRMANKLNQARGPVEVLVPLRGFSAYDQAGAAFEDRMADAAFRDALKSHLNGTVTMQELDLHVNDELFADEVVAAVDRIIGDGLPA